jgi:hypothetical protein
VIPEFDMREFEGLLKTRTDQIDDQLMEMLLSFSDFVLFKEIMIGDLISNDMFDS